MYWLIDRLSSPNYRLLKWYGFWPIVQVFKISLSNIDNHSFTAHSVVPDNVYRHRLVISKDEARTQRPRLTCLILTSNDTPLAPRFAPVKSTQHTHFCTDCVHRFRCYREKRRRSLYLTAIVTFCVAYYTRFYALSKATQARRTRGSSRKTRAKTANFTEMLRLVVSSSKKTQLVRNDKNVASWPTGACERPGIQTTTAVRKRIHRAVCSACLLASFRCYTNRAYSNVELTWVAGYISIRCTRPQMLINPSIGLK